MITHKIDKYEVPVAEPYSGWHGKTPETDYRKRLEMGKLEYALLLKTLSAKVGDLVVSQYNSKPYAPHVVFEIVDIDEIHKFVRDWGSEATGPMIYRLRGISDHNLNYSFPGGCKTYQKVAEADIPESWKEKRMKEHHVDT